MDSHSLIPASMLDDVMPFVFVMMLVALVPLPAIVFSIARKWGHQQPDVATTALAGAVIVCVFAILAVTFLGLVVVGWLPPLDQLMN